jgi:hypothetical protein
VALPIITNKYYTVSDIQDQHNFTLSWVRVHTAGAPYRQSCEEFQGQLDKNVQATNELQQKLNELFVKAFLMDRDLNDIAKKVNALIPLQKDQDPATLQERLFRGLPLSLFLKPILGGQLTAMIDWVSPLKASSHPELHSIGVELEAKTMLATKIERDLNAAEKALEDFLTMGGRIDLFNDFNALRNNIHKGVGKDHPELAEEFFLHDTSRTATLEASLQASQKRIEQLQSALDTEKKKQAELQTKKATRDAEEASRQEALQTLAQIKQQQAALKQQAAQAKAKSKKK